MRVLVVEDAVKVGRLIKRGLEEEHVAVDLVLTGEEAVWIATENEYDAIVLESHGGTVSAETTEAGGARVTLTFPQIRAGLTNP